MKLTSIKEAADAYRLPESLIRRLIREKRIQQYRFSPRNIRIDLDELREYAKKAA